MWLTIIIAFGIVCYILCDRIADAKNLGGWWGLAGFFWNFCSYSSSRYAQIGSP